MKKGFTPLQMIDSADIDYGNVSSKIVKKKRFLSVTGFTLIETMVVVLIFTFLFAAILTVLATSDRSWRIGQDKLVEQQEARKAMDSISKLLRQSNPDWIINGTNYPVSITSDTERIDFYQPLFDDLGNISTLRKITFKLDTVNTTQLLKKEGLDNPVVVANYIEGISFGGGCAGCAAFNCLTVANDCPVVTIEIKTKKNAEFRLLSRITLRNQNVTLSEDVVVEQPAEGEF